MRLKHEKTLDFATIVTDNSSLTDYNKLVAYRNTICELVSYNNEATAPGYPYGDPWQLIYVFDGDESTNVVCEGYSKAFKYLCDLSAFTNDITCSLVTGRMAGGTGEGNHMWNIVAIGGSNYLVDVTNCDTRTVGAPDQLFLCGVSGSVNGSYTATVGSSSIIYTYDESTRNNYTENELTLSPTAYTPSGAATPLLGDVNKDGKIDANDMQRIYAHISGENVFSDLAQGDVNGDSKVDANDMQRIYAHISGENLFH